MLGLGNLFQNTAVLHFGWYWVSLWVILGKSFRIEYLKFPRLLGSLKWHEEYNVSLLKIEIPFKMQSGHEKNLEAVIFLWYLCIFKTLGRRFWWWNGNGYHHKC